MSAGESTARAWLTIFRLGLVQTAIGSLTVLSTSTLPRLMTVELSLLAVIPAVLVGAHYAVQVSRLRFGYGSDVGGRRTPWIIGGLLVLAGGSILAAWSVTLMVENTALGLAVALPAYVLVGMGVGAAGTTVLALLATEVAPERRAPAATLVWLMMILGLVVTAISAGSALVPFSYARLLEVAGIVAAIAVGVGTLAILGVERSRAAPEPQRERSGALAALAEIWREPAARTFTVFVFISMFAYNMQELVLEPFSALVYGFSPGESTKLSGMHQQGVLAGLLLFAAVGRLFRSRQQALTAIIVVGCAGSAAGLAAIATSAFFADTWPLQPTVMAYGVANGAFAGAAIASMFSLAGVGRERREGTRMGIWGAAQAIGFGLGMFAGAVSLDIARALLADAHAFAAVFTAEAAIFVVATFVALTLSRAPERLRAAPAPA
jgi:BCD family chlorophyll transporter-like MFS transporter